MNNRREGRRDVALTTLIDLLVQIVFVFTLLLVATGAIEGSPKERGFITPDEWKTLVSIFDLDSTKDTASQINEVRERMEAATAERDRAMRDKDALRAKVDELDAKIAALEKRGQGAPGLPPCRATDGSEIVLITAAIDANGFITPTAAPGASRFQNVPNAIARISGRRLTRLEFPIALSAYRLHGLSRVPQCRYTATVSYDPRAKAGDYQPSISSIYSVFRIQQINRKGN